MYNNVGLTTARGTGTSGYIQRNLGFVNAKDIERSTYVRREREAPKPRIPSFEVREHIEKRDLESQIIDHRIELENRGYNSENIEDQVNKFRQQLFSSMAIPNIPKRRL